MSLDDLNDVVSLQHAMAHIRDTCRGDPEAAHGAEDDLMRHVLRMVAEGHPQAAEMATEALKAAEWDVPRWCA